MRTQPAGPLELASRHPWLWGVYFGGLVAVAVVLLSAVTRGFRPELLLLGLILLLAFGAVSVIGHVVRRHTPGGPT